MANVDDPLEFTVEFSPAFRLVSLILRSAVNERARHLSLVKGREDPLLGARGNLETKVYILQDNHFRIPPPRRLFDTISSILGILANGARARNLVGQFVHEKNDPSSDLVGFTELERWDIDFAPKAEGDLLAELRTLLKAYAPEVERVLEAAQRRVQ